MGKGNGMVLLTYWLKHVITISLHNTIMYVARLGILFLLDYNGGYIFKLPTVLWIHTIQGWRWSVLLGWRLLWNQLQGILVRFLWLHIDSFLRYIDGEGEDREEEDDNNKTIPIIVESKPSLVHIRGGMCGSLHSLRDQSYSLPEQNYRRKIRMGLLYSLSSSSLPHQQWRGKGR